jgi:hypothetical protein
LKSTDKCAWGFNFRLMMAARQAAETPEKGSRIAAYQTKGGRTMQYTTLDNVPEPLQKRVNEELERFNYAKLLSVVVMETTPYKDKSIIDTIYKAFIEVANYCYTYTYTVCSKPEWNFSTDKVRESALNYFEIEEFVKKSSILRYGVRRALNDEQT